MHAARWVYTFHLPATVTIQNRTDAVAYAANYRPAPIIDRLVYEWCTDNFRGLRPVPLPLNSSVDCYASI